MTKNEIKKLLNDLQSKKVSLEDAISTIEHSSIAELQFANLDLDRENRCGVPEVIFAQNKTNEHVTKIIRSFIKNKQNVLATRVSAEMAKAVQQKIKGLKHNPAARTLSKIINKPQKHNYKVALICAGTSDLPVAEEARETLEFLGIEVETHNDVGVAGLHRLMSHLEEIRKASVVIVCAGMEGALPSVVGGLVDCPMIAVPTSVGYGASFNGLSALLGMLNSCVAGIMVVNIDNGFGAACAANSIIRRIENGG